MLLHVLLLSAMPLRAPLAALRGPAVRSARVRASSAEPEPTVRSILDLEPFQRVKKASEVVAVAAARSRGRGKEANDVLIHELLEAPSLSAAIQLHYDWVSSLKFLRGVQVRLEGCQATDAARAARLSGLMAAIRAEMQVRMDVSQRLVQAQLGELAADPLAMRALARRGLLDESLVMMLVAHAAETGRKARVLDAARDAAAPAAAPRDDGSVARLEALLQRLAQGAMRELDLAVAPEFLVLRRLMQIRAPAARAELAARATAGDRLVTDRAVDLEKLLEVVREFARIEAACEPPDKEAKAKLTLVERELAGLLGAGAGGAAP